MRSKAENARTGIRARLLQVLTAFGVAAGLVASAVLWGAASTPPVTPARADVRSAAEAPPSSAPERAESRFVASGATVPDAAPLEREAHSDGGYWYWLERQPAGSRR
jgi:hypothetical protein